MTCTKPAAAFNAWQVIQWVCVPLCAGTQKSNILPCPEFDLVIPLFMQDLMDAQIIPADTDYRMFSYDYYGSLPGVDIAFLLDSSAYHTHEDAPHRVRPGIVQVVSYLSCLPVGVHLDQIPR